MFGAASLVMRAWTAQPSYTAWRAAGRVAAGVRGRRQGQAARRKQLERDMHANMYELHHASWAFVDAEVNG